MIVFVHPREHTLRILLLGDVVGRAGRRILGAVLPGLRLELGLDCVLANGENLAGGFGITKNTYGEIRASGVDVLTMGNHWKDKGDVHGLVAGGAPIVLPANRTGEWGPYGRFPLPGGGRDLVVVNLLGQFAMSKEYGNPFTLLAQTREGLAACVQAGESVVVVDFHGEATSEKQGAAWFLDGIAAAVVGTHTHTPTSDERVTARGTAFTTDLGMTGAYDSVIGMTRESSLGRLFSQETRGPLKTAERDPWVCGLVVEVSRATGLALAAHRIQYRERAGAGWEVSSRVPPPPPQ